MTRRRRRGAVVSPAVIGAATVLVALVGVVLAYNANRGLPFIKTYDIQARVADAKKLTTGVDVRIGGKRVGQVADIEAEKGRDGAFTSRLALKLDRSVGALPVDTTLRIRPESIIGSKFVELVPGESKRTLKAGATIPEDRTSASVDLDEVTGLFDEGLRRSFQSVVEQSSYGVAGRAAQLNDALVVLPEVLDSSQRFLQTVSDPATDLGGLIQGLDAAEQAVLPALPDVGGLLRGARRTLDAVAAESPSLAATIRDLPGTEDETRRAAREVTPVLRDVAALAKELRPGVRQLPATVDALHDVAVRGIPVLRDTPSLAGELTATLRTLDGALQRGTTKDSLTMLVPIAENLLPTLRTVVPQQTKCNYAGLFARNASSAGSAGDENGNWLRIGLVLNLAQTLRTPDADPNLHYQVYPDNDPGGCAVGNEPYARGKVIGAVPGYVSGPNQQTSAPPGTPKGPR
ncbi:MlaD family protein [Patulibacter sp. SYSU D01012]|uniref:MlaD family protein n=1 Tax=Patulibacter sp. SYSU D01012 TaxID=2817381 RepID=UPI001B30ED83|nr:MlaD family protein [Patulibacter sp. SYSU D01012]